MTEEQTIQALHAAYVRLTGLPVPYNHGRRFTWLAWIARGFTEADLATVVGHYRRTVDKDIIRMRMMKFDRLIGDTQRFEEDLAEAKAMHRPGPATTQTVQTGSTARIIPAPGTHDTSKPAAQIVRGLDPQSRWTLSPENLAAWELMKQGLK